MKIGLREKYSFIIVLLTFIISGMLAGYLFFEFRKITNSIVRQSARELKDKLTAQLESRGRLMVGILAESLPNALYYTDMPAIDEIIATALKQKDVLHILVFDHNGKII